MPDSTGGLAGADPVRERSVAYVTDTLRCPGCELIEQGRDHVPTERSGYGVKIQTAARIILGLQGPHTRDAALSTAEGGDLPCERQLWGHLARRCVPPHTGKAPPLLTLLGWVAWRQGDTATASHAFAEALDIYPGYTLAKLMLDGIRNGCDLAQLLATFRETV
ncbi:hypothetical protein J2Z21_009584 [Streptomyces griseochromogenes]|uniref:DUF4192 domain-containing protein n=1 Tax=Streptomyces griseochromogenes TaxID=68214 RepID=A0A1B1AWZ4_9ACTN|nr:DUF4192 family protein [Streptomyces griseochromogenes]ANP51104.1 hypothetical protein AVL59_17070 [Streptomyces griseochromogenes]MBP2056565.1 hypothetical protein [Streptomyces griseochromogenes]